MQKHGAGYCHELVLDCERLARLEMSELRGEGSEGSELFLELVVEARKRAGRVRERLKTRVRVLHADEV